MLCIKCGHNTTTSYDIKAGQQIASETCSNCGHVSGSSITTPTVRTHQEPSMNADAQMVRIAGSTIHNPSGTSMMSDVPITKQSPLEVIGSKVSQFTARLLKPSVSRQYDPSTAPAWFERQHIVPERVTPPNSGLGYKTSPYVSEFIKMWGITPIADLSKYRLMYRTVPKVKRAIDKTVSSAIIKGFNRLEIVNNTWYPSEYSSVDEYHDAIILFLQTWIDNQPDFYINLNMIGKDMLTYGNAFVELVYEEMEVEERSLKGFSQYEIHKEDYKWAGTGPLDAPDAPMVEVKNPDEKLVEVSPKGKMLWMKPLDPLYMRVRADAYGNVFGYIQFIAVPPVAYTTEKMAHFRYNPLSWQYETLNGCIDEDELVYTTNGLIKIKDITNGMDIYTFNDNKMDITSVKCLIDKGIQEGFEIKTLHRRIIATDIHPFLVVKNNELIWKAVKDLEINDEVVITSKLPDTDLILKLNPPNNKNDSSSKDGRDYSWLIKDVECPEYGTKELARLWGFMVGDGWISESTGQIAFALSVYNDLNKKYIDLFKTIFNIDLKETKHRQMYTYSRKIESFFKNNDWLSGCENKKVPEWVLKSNDEIKSEFLEGYIDADGYKYDNMPNQKSVRCNLETINYNLLHDLKELINSLGYRCGSIRKRKQRNYDTYINERKINNKNGSYLLSFSYIPLHRKNNLIFGDDLNTEKIKSIESVGDRHVYDISVEGDSKNFIANGIVAHNTSMLMSIIRTQEIIWQIENDLILLGHATVKPPMHFACGDKDNIWPVDVFNGFISDTSNRSAGGDLYTRGDVKGTPLPAPAAGIPAMVKYLDYHDTQRTIALGVPPQLLGEPEGSSRTTAEVSLDDWVNMLQNIQREISNTLEEQVFKHIIIEEFGEGAPVPTPIWNPLFDKNENDITNRIVSLTASGIVSINEARKWLADIGVKLQPVDGAEVLQDLERFKLEVEQTELSIDEMRNPSAEVSASLKKDTQQFINKKQKDTMSDISHPPGMGVDRIAMDDGGVGDIGDVNQLMYPGLPKDKKKK